MSKRLPYRLLILIAAPVNTFAQNATQHNDTAQSMWSQSNHLNRWVTIIIILIILLLLTFRLTKAIDKRTHK